MVDRLEVGGFIKSLVVSKAMKLVDRATFTKFLPYQDCPSPIGFQACINAPHIDAIILELLKDPLLNSKKPIRALDVGSGSGYLACLMAALML